MGQTDRGFRCCLLFCFLAKCKVSLCISYKQKRKLTSVSLLPIQRPSGRRKSLANFSDWGLYVNTREWKTKVVEQSCDPRKLNAGGACQVCKVRGFLNNRKALGTVRMTWAKGPGMMLDTRDTFFGEGEEMV